MPQVVADRFIRSNGTWIDLATGQAIHLRIVHAGPRRAELEWDMRCATLANLRHPLINPLIDYGSIDGDRLFEAYEVRAPIALTRAAASRSIAHAFRFLRAHGIAVARADTDFVLRPIETGRSAGPRTLGVILQHRQAFAVLGDTLDAGSPAGASVVSIQGAPQSGLRTTRVLVARAARLHGYVPVATSVVDWFASLPGQVAGRHVCVFGTVEWTRGVSIASLLTRLSTEGARRHVVLLFDRPGIQATPGAVTLERMGVTAMSGMVFVDSEQGPKPGEVFAAARAADGRPGKCLERLGAGTYEPVRPKRFAVHELPQSYDARSPAGAGAIEGFGERRGGGVARRAIERSEVLVARGRHAAAERVLARALRVHHGRGATDDEVLTSLRLGHLALDRGRVEAAALAFQRAREASPPQEPWSRRRSASGCHGWKMED